MPNESAAAGQRPFRPSGYYPHPRAIEKAMEVEYEHMPMPTFDGMAMIAMTPDASQPPGSAIEDGALRVAYFNAFLDLHKLVGEYRFHVTFANVIAFDVEEKVRAGLAEKREPVNKWVERLGIADEARVLLLRYMRGPPPAVQFFSDPHVLIAGDRRFSGWIAAQMIDSALVRGVAACDRVATMLWTRVGRPLPRGRTGSEFLPEFSERRLLQIADEYAALPEWMDLMALTTHAIYKTVRNIRDGFTHARRIPSELHGERLVSWLESEVTRGVDAGTYLALGPGFYELVMLPVVELGGKLLAAKGAV